MIFYKTRDEIELIRESSLLVAKALGEVGKHIKPGVSTLKLDKITEAFISDHGGIPAFKNYRGFPNSICISINEEVVHGIPGKRVLKEGDLVSIDVGVLMDGFYGDSAYTFSVGEVDGQLAKLMKVTMESLYKGIEQAVAGKRLGDISYAIQECVEIKNDFYVVRDLVGHGIGKRLHEEPEVPNYGTQGQGIKLQEGLVLAIEPMVNVQTKNVLQTTDGWTIITADRLASAHFEHTIAIQKGKADILTSFDFIEGHQIMELETF